MLNPLPLILEPTPGARIANFCAALFIAGAGALSVWGGLMIGLREHNGWVLVVVGAPFAIYGLVVAPGIFRLRITLDVSRAVVQGYFLSAEIPRSSISKITDYPAIVWRSADGRQRKTYVNALSVFRGWITHPRLGVSAQNDAKVDALRRWAVAQAS